MVETMTEWKECFLRVNTDYVTRILDNLTSNIIKYADPAEPVVLQSVYQDGMAGFSIQNGIIGADRKAESTGIGMPSIRSMMKKMNGTCKVWQLHKPDQSHPFGQCGSSFKVEILFPVCGESIPFPVS